MRCDKTNSIQLLGFPLCFRWPFSITVMVCDRSCSGWNGKPRDVLKAQQTPASDEVSSHASEKSMVECVLPKYPYDSAAQEGNTVITPDTAYGLYTQKVEKAQLVGRANFSAPE